MKKDKELLPDQSEELLKVLKDRFHQNMHLHKNLQWTDVENKLMSLPEKMRSVYEMERTGGEPDVVDLSEDGEEYIFCDCSVESPKGRRSLCYDDEALKERKKFKPENSAVQLAEEMGVELLTEDLYFKLQQFAEFDTKTSSWLKTPADIRKPGGAIFGDYRYGRVFIYHNGASSYYAARGFRAMLRL